MKLPKAAFALAMAAFMLFATEASANAWKMGPLRSQVPIIQEAQDLQETDRREFFCLALALYHEARGETITGLHAVGSVIQNRRATGRYPKSICGVVWQDRQFTWTGYPVGAIIPREKTSWQKVQRIALAVIDGKVVDPTNGATHFHDKSVRPSWARKATRTWREGALIFVSLPGFTIHRMPNVEKAVEAIIVETTIAVHAAVKSATVTPPETDIEFTSLPQPKKLQTRKRWLLGD